MYYVGSTLLYFAFFVLVWLILLIVFVVRLPGGPSLKWPIMCRAGR